jgi:hypothetical protein
MPQPTAAEALFPHLAHRDDPPKQQPRAQSLADAMYPKLTQRQRAWDEWRERERQRLLKNLRETTARWQKERGR